MIVGDLQVGTDRRLAVRDQAQFCGGAAHIEGQHAALAGDTAAAPRGDTTAPRLIRAG